MNSKFSYSFRLVTVCVIGLILMAACTNRKVYGSGDIVEETRDLQSFTEVVLSEEGDLFIEVGDQERFVVEAEDNLQEYLVAEVINGVLDIKKIPENVTLNATKPIRYYLTVKELESLTVKNSGNVEITDVDTDNFSVRITGSGSVHIETLNANRLDIELSSSGNFVVDRGEIFEQYVRLSSSGEYVGKEVACQNASLKITSSGNATVNVSDVLTADLSSSGNVYYVGNPRIDYEDSSSSGRVIPLP